MDPQPLPANPPKPPVMARRTYTCLRLSAVGVIAVLAVSLVKEYLRLNPNCLQGSISAYYYTAVQSVFVGALVTLGVIMIALWGKTAWEDGALNLAGLVAPVVAFVPTAKPDTCGLITTSGNETPAQVVDANRDGIFNNMLSYLIVVGAVLLIVFVVGLIAYRKKWTFVTERPLAYWAPWGVALVLYVVGTVVFGRDREWFYTHAHDYSATLLFIFILTAVIEIGIQKWPEDEHPRTRMGRWWKKALDLWRDVANSDPDQDTSRRWAFTYWGLAALMILGAAVLYFAIDAGHHTFAVESWMIGWLAVFWLIQTGDRWNDGAPRIDAETQGTAVAHQAAGV